MQCEEVRDQFTDYLTESLEEPLRSEVQQHLITCDSCRTEAEGLKMIWTKLGGIPSSQPGSELRARFDVMLEAYKQGLDHAPSRNWWAAVNSWISAWWPQQPVFQFGLAMALLIAGVAIGLRFQSTPATSQPANDVAELRTELHQMRQMVALSLMQQESATERLKGVNWSYQLQQPDREVLMKLLDTLMHDPNVNVRLAAIDALRQFGGQPVVRRGVVDALAQQDSPMVQVALIDLVVDLREKTSIEMLRKLTEDQNVNESVRQRAKKGLSELE